MTKLTPNNCLDCAMERQEYGAMYCPIHYMLMPDIADSLYDKSTNTLWFVVYIGAFQYQLENAKGERKAIDFEDVSNYKLIKSHD